MEYYGNRGRCIGKGSYGTVYETDKGYAIKKLKK